MCIELRAVNEQADIIETGRLYMSCIREAKGTIYIFWSSAPKNLVDLEKEKLEEEKKLLSSLVK